VLLKETSPTGRTTKKERGGEGKKDPVTEPIKKSEGNRGTTPSWNTREGHTSPTFPPHEKRDYKPDCGEIRSQKKPVKSREERGGWKEREVK